MDMDVDVDDLETDPSLDVTVHSSRPHPRSSDFSEGLQYVTENENLSIDTDLAKGSRPNLDRTYTGGSQDGEGESPGLDALAMAASGVTG